MALLPGVLQLARLTGEFEFCHLVNPVSTRPAGLAVTWPNAPQTIHGSYPVTATINNPNHQSTATGDVRDRQGRRDGNAHTARRLALPRGHGLCSGQSAVRDRCPISSGNKITLDTATTLAGLEGSRIAAAPTGCWPISCRLPRSRLPAACCSATPPPIPSPQSLTRMPPGPRTP